MEADTEICDRSGRSLTNKTVCESVAASYIDQPIYTILFNRCLGIYSISIIVDLVKIGFRDTET